MTGTSAMLQAAKLWEKTSAAGNVYLVGRLGGVRILILRNRAAGTEGEPDWNLFFTEPTSSATSTSSVSRRKRRASGPPPLAAASNGREVPDDPIADLYRDDPPSGQP
jgi:hypothetical protein